MSSSELATAPVTPGFHKATSMLSATLGIEPRMMVDTLKRQCFPNQNADAVSDAQLAAFISVANDLDLNPLLPGMLYAYPGKNGAMVPVTGPDGVFKMLDKRITGGTLDGYECIVYPEDMTQKPTHATATIWRKGSEHPSKYTALLSEWQVSSNPNWGARPRHMLWVRALKQCARQVIHGIPLDEDEVAIGGLKDVTPQQERPEPPARKPRGSKAVQQEVVVPQEPAAQPPPPDAAPEPAKSDANDASQVANPVPMQQATAMPKLTLRDGEKLSGIITVQDSAPFLISLGGVPTPSVKAEVTGDFKGLVYHKGGGVMADGKPAITPMWAKGSRLKVTLSGFLNRVIKDPETKLPYPDGKLQVFVDSVTPEVPAEEVMDA